jgi:hypothetical protein
MKFWMTWEKLASRALHAFFNRCANFPAADLFCRSTSAAVAIKSRRIHPALQIPGELGMPDP